MIEVVGSAGLLCLMLGDLLVEHMIVELLKVLLCKLVVQLATMWLDDVAAAGRRTICQGVLLFECYFVLEDLLVLRRRVLVRD